MSKLIKKVIIYVLDKLIYFLKIFEDKELHEISDKDSEVDVEKGKPSSGDSKFDSVVRKLDLWWGIIFRIIFISYLGFSTFNNLNTNSIGDIPIANLTLNQVFNYIFLFLIPIILITWLFNVPTRIYSEKSHPYELWSAFGYLVMLIMLVYMLYVLGLFDYIFHKIINSPHKTGHSLDN
ncbi:MAG: hypothetical protein MH321_08895 [Leptospiraceae bacterium]|nr:hypothetical protein [Leptospiraceae bacterium]